jgi:Leucine-rich repeat (LRR) protein
VRLDLSDNQLTALPGFFGSAFPHLAVLELRNNLLAAGDLPKDVSGLARSLKSLNLSGNRLEVIPPQLFELTGQTVFEYFKFLTVTFLRGRLGSKTKDGPFEGLENLCEL